MGRIPDLMIGAPGGAAVGAMICTPLFRIGEKSYSRFLVAIELLKFYRTIGREAKADGVLWVNRMRNLGNRAYCMPSH